MIYCGIIRPGFIRKLILINGSINWGQVKSSLYQPQPAPGPRYQSLLFSRHQRQVEAGYCGFKGSWEKNIWYLGFWVLKLLNGPLDSMLHCTTYKSSCLWYDHASSHIIHNVDWALDILILDWWLYDNYHWVRDYRRILPTQHIFHSHSLRKW